MNNSQVTQVELKSISKPSPTLKWKCYCNTVNVSRKTTLIFLSKSKSCKLQIVKGDGNCFFEQYAFIYWELKSKHYVICLLLERVENLNQEILSTKISHWIKHAGTH